MKKLTAVLISTAALTACSHSDMENVHGATTYPSGQLRLEANTAVPKAYSEYVYFDGKSDAIGSETLNAFTQFRDQGVDGVWIYGPREDAMRPARQLSIKRMFRGMGVEGSRIYSDIDSDLKTGNYRVDVAYTTMQAPACPNWSASSTSNFTNQPYTQFGCASVNNLGQQLRNPRDVERGHGNLRPSLAVKAIENYNSNSTAAASSPLSGGGAQSSGSNSGSGSGSSSSTGSSSTGTGGATGQ